MEAQEAENAPDLANRGGKSACGRVGESRGRCCEALQATRGADSEAAAHQKAEVEGRGLKEHPFSDLLLAVQMDAAQPYSAEIS